MIHYFLLFILAAIGMSETAYLIKERIIKKRKLVCVIGDKCNIVLESKYNGLLGIPNEVFGFIFYLLILIIMAFLVIGLEPIVLWFIIAQIFIAIAAIVSLILTYIQWNIIKEWCFWCVLSTITNILMAIIIFGVELV